MSNNRRSRTTRTGGRGRPDRLVWTAETIRALGVSTDLATAAQTTALSILIDYLGK